jgi:hypothetical protein
VKYAAWPRKCPKCGEDTELVKGGGLFKDVIFCPKEQECGWRIELTTSSTVGEKELAKLKEDNCIEDND